MKDKINGKLIRVLISMFLILTASYCFAYEYEITKVIEIGTAYWYPTSQPLKWSPDGLYLSYFIGNTLYLCDSLGNSMPEHTFENNVHSYEWINESEICFRLYGDRTLDSFNNQIVVYNITTNQIDIIDEYIRYKYYHDLTDTYSFMGPYKSIENKTYYVKTYYNGPYSTRIAGSSISIIEDHPNIKTSDAHILKWGTDGVYIHSIIENDSSLIYKKKCENVNCNAIINSKQTYLLYDEKLLNLITGQELTLSVEHVKPTDSSIICSFLSLYFNPKYDEILFHLNCDNLIDQGISINKVIAYNITLDKYNIIQPWKDNSDYAVPAYHPDGAKIAFLSDNKAYIMYRNILGEKQ